jgi:chromosome partitioning protein
LATGQINFACEHRRISANNSSGIKWADGTSGAIMSLENADLRSRVRMIVVGNEKGGSGKSTIAMHLAVALLKSKQRVATIDLDSRQKTFTHYIENRHAWAQQTGRDLEIPNHVYFVENMDHPTPEDEVADGKALADQVEVLARKFNFIVIDNPGRDSYLGRLAHSMADILITPLNDSFVDLDVLAAIDRETLEVTDTSHYSRMVENARLQRHNRNNVSVEWIVLRNRLSMLGSRNSRCVGEVLQELSRRLNFRCVEGLAERVIFREFYLRGLTALDALDETTLGTRPTMSHVSARLEIETLLSAIQLPLGGSINDEMTGHSRDAA